MKGYIGHSCENQCWHWLSIPYMEDLRGVFKSFANRYTENTQSIEI